MQSSRSSYQTVVSCVQTNKLSVACKKATRNELFHEVDGYIHPHHAIFHQYPGAYFLSNSYVKRQKSICVFVCI